MPLRERDGQVYVLLITTRGRGRRVIPKGRAAKGIAAHALAARKAVEEAGRLGHAGATPRGVCSYRRRLPSGRRATCEVAVFALAVESRAEDWPERGQRRKRRVPPAPAAELVADPGLAALLLDLRLDLGRAAA